MIERRAIAYILPLALVLFFVPLAPAAEPRSADVVVYGATPAGIAAALAAADDGQSVLLIEPTDRIGGMITCGLSHADFRTFEGLTGAYKQLMDGVQKHYVAAYGAGSPQAKGNFRGTHAEPKVNLAVFEALLAEREKIQVLKGRTLKGVELISADDGRRRIGSLHVAGRDAEWTYQGRVFIDATYEGDLMAAAKVAYKVGREGKDAFGESLAPERADEQLQGYNFRLIMTTVADNRVAPKPPEGYRREEFADLLPLISTGKITKAFGAQGEPIVLKAQAPPLPNGKFDINDVSKGVVRLSLPSENLAWPEGDAAARERIFQEHLRWNLGLIYFLQNDEAVPEALRREASRWGFCKDEFVESNHVPPQLYIREARRMQGVFIFTQNDCEPAPNDARSVLRRDAIAMGDYGPNCHGTGHEGSRFGGKHTGEFYYPVAPYQVPYGVLVPKDVANLLVPVAVSASHVGFCALRLEPIWMSLGQAAGHAAALVEEDVQQVPVDKLQARLHEAGSATIYVSDVPPGHADFAAVQWWGTLGGLHGLAHSPEKKGQRGAKIVGQYYEAFPGHAAALDEALPADVAERWTKLASEHSLDVESLPRANGKSTRGDFIRAAYRQRIAK